MFQRALWGSSVLAVAFCVCGSASGEVSTTAAVTIYPGLDGTLVDGGVYGTFDGVADDWDYTFDESGYEGTISRTVASPSTSREHRVFWEYRLYTVPYDPPISATLTFTIRGVSTSPFPDSEVFIYAYPSDLRETSSDFSDGPETLQGSVTIIPYQPPTVYRLDVSDLLNEALSGGAFGVAFRFQINPDTSSIVAQAFIDALDSQVKTKPYLAIDESPRGDLDGDRDVDLTDFQLFGRVSKGLVLTRSRPALRLGISTSTATSIFAISAYSSFLSLDRRSPVALLHQRPVAGTHSETAHSAHRHRSCHPGSDAGKVTVRAVVYLCRAAARWRSSASMNVWMSPSSTPWVLDVVTAVRASLTRCSG